MRERESLGAYGRNQWITAWQRRTGTHGSRARLIAGVERASEGSSRDLAHLLPVHEEGDVDDVDRRRRHLGDQLRRADEKILGRWPDDSEHRRLCGRNATRVASEADD